MKVWNIIKIKTIIGKWNEKRLDISTILTTFDEETAKRNFVGLTTNGTVSPNGTCVIYDWGTTETIYKLSCSPLVLNTNDCTKDMDDLYCAYKELLVSRLKQWGEKEISKLGDEIYRLDINAMDYYIIKEGLQLVKEIVLEINSGNEYLSLVLGNEKYVMVHNSELAHIEKFVSFIAELTKFMSNR